MVPTIRSYIYLSLAQVPALDLASYSSTGMLRWILLLEEHRQGQREVRVMPKTAGFKTLLFEPRPRLERLPIG